MSVTKSTWSRYCVSRDTEMAVFEGFDVTKSTQSLSD